MEREASKIARRERNRDRGEDLWAEINRKLRKIEKNNNRK